MTNEQIEADWRRASRALLAAGMLLKNGLPEDAVSRAYYAVLHASRAALMMKGVTAKTHTGVRRMFGTELVSTGEIEAEWSKVLARAQSARESADYDTVTLLPEERAAEVISEAGRFVERIGEYLKSQGFEIPGGT